MYHRAVVDATESECIEHQGKHQTQCGQRCIFHRLLCWMYRFTAALETFSSVLLRSHHSHRHLVPARGHDWGLVGALQKGKPKAGCSRSGVRVDAN